MMGSGPQRSAKTERSASILPAPTPSKLPTPPTLDPAASLNGLAASNAEIQPAEVLSLQQSIGNQAVQSLLIQRKGQTQKSRTKHQATIDLTVDARAAALVDLLESGKTKDNEETLAKVADLLYGWAGDDQEVAVDNAYQQACNQKGKTVRTVRAALQSKFSGSPWRERYLLSVLEQGNAPPLMKLALALGLVTHGEINWGIYPFRPGDAKEVLKILEGESWGATELAEMRQPEFQTAFKRLERSDDKVKKRINAFLTFQDAQLQRADRKNPTAGERTQEAPLEVAHLVTIVKQHANRNWRWFIGIDKEALFAAVKGWADKASPEARALAAQANSPFDQQLQKLLGTRLGRLRKHDYHYLFDLVQGHTTQPNTQDVVDPMAPQKKVNVGGIAGRLDITQQDLGRTEDAWKQEVLNQPGQAQAETVVKQKQKVDNLPAISTLHALIEREKSKWDSKWIKKRNWSSVRYQHRKLKAHIEGMSDEQREQYLLSLLSTQDTVTWWDPNTLPAAKANLYQQALGTFEAKLQTAGLKDKEIADLKARFHFKGELGSMYHQLVQLVARRARKGWDDDKFGDKALGIITKLRGDEFRQVREDPTLWAALDQHTQGKWRTRIKAVFGLRHFADNQPVQPGTQSTQEERSAKARADAEESPMHWAILLDRRVKQHNWITVPKGKVLAIMQQAQVAARRKYPIDPTAPQPQQQQQQQQRDQFIDEIWANLSPSTNDFLKRLSFFGGMKNQRSKFKQHQEISPLDRIKYASRNIKTRKGEILAVIEDSTGQELLGLSNLQDFVALMQERQQQPPPRPIVQIDAELDAFIIDLKPEVITQLERYLGSWTGGETKKLTEVLSKARRKLATALTTDESFQRAILAAGVAQGDLPILQERTKALALLDEERLSKRGIQWGTLSVRSMERQEAAWRYKGTHRSMKGQLGNLREGQGLSDTQKQERAKQIKGSVEEIQSAEKEWTSRKDAFEAMRTKYSGRLKKLIGLILTVAVAVGAGFLTAGLGSVATAFILAGLAILKKGVEAGIAALVDGGIEATGQELLQWFIMTAVEAGVQVASTVIAIDVIKPMWDGITLDTDKLPHGWYKQDGCYTAGGLFAEGGKRSAQGVFNKVAFSGFQNMINSFVTEEDPLGNLRRHPGRSIAEWAKDLTQGAVLTLFQTVVGEATKDAILREQRQEAARRDKARVAANKEAGGTGTTKDLGKSEWEQRFGSGHSGETSETAIQERDTAQDVLDAIPDEKERYDEAFRINDAWSDYDEYQQAKLAYDAEVANPTGPNGTIDSTIEQTWQREQQEWSQVDPYAKNWYDSQGTPPTQSTVTQNLTNAENTWKSHPDHASWSSNDPTQSSIYTNYNQATAVKDHWNDYDEYVKAKQAYDAEVANPTGPNGTIDPTIQQTWQQEQREWGNINATAKSWYESKMSTNQPVTQQDTETLFDNAKSKYDPLKSWVDAGKPESVNAQEKLKDTKLILAYATQQDSASYKQASIEKGFSTYGALDSATRLGVPGVTNFGVQEMGKPLLDATFLGPIPFKPVPDQGAPSMGSWRDEAEQAKARARAVRDKGDQLRAALQNSQWANEGNQARTLGRAAQRLGQGVGARPLDDAMTQVEQHRTTILNLEAQPQPHTRVQAQQLRQAKQDLATASDAVRSRTRESNQASEAAEKYIAWLLNKVKAHYQTALDNALTAAENDLARAKKYGSPSQHAALLPAINQALTDLGAQTTEQPFRTAVGHMELSLSALESLASDEAVRRSSPDVVQRALTEILRTAPLMTQAKTALDQALATLWTNLDRRGATWDRRAGSARRKATKVAALLGAGNEQDQLTQLAQDVQDAQQRLNTARGQGPRDDIVDHLCTTCDAVMAVENALAGIIQHKRDYAQRRYPELAQRATNTVQDVKQRARTLRGQLNQRPRDKKHRVRQQVRALLDDVNDLKSRRANAIAPMVQSLQQETTTKTNQVAPYLQHPHTAIRNTASDTVRDHVQELLALTRQRGRLQRALEALVQRMDSLEQDAQQLP